MLPAEDVTYLKAKRLKYEETLEGGFLCVVIFGYELPAGYSQGVVDLLVCLPAGWPDTNPDMFWVDPPIAYADGTEPGQSSGRGDYVGRTWQRFSRHVPNGVWRPGDNLETWMTMIRDILAREVKT